MKRFVVVETAEDDCKKIMSVDDINDVGPDFDNEDEVWVPDMFNKPDVIVVDTLRDKKALKAIKEWNAQ